MADVEPKEETETLMEKIADKLHHRRGADAGDGDGSSSSDSDSDSDKPSASDSIKSAAYRLFGRQKPVHSVLGGGKPADVLLWRNKKISGGVLGVATAIWVLFELIEYHLLSLVCHCLILALALAFLGSNASNLINKSPMRIPEVTVSEDAVVNVALALRFEINRALFFLREVALGRGLKRFLAVIAGVWVLSIVGGWCNFLTLIYIAFVLLHTVPVLYEKYEDQVDPFAEKAIAEFKKQYAVFDEKVLSKIPIGPLKAKKQA